MNDSAQDLEQLIHQYTQELLRFQKHYAAQMGETAAVPTVLPVSEELPTAEPLDQPVMADPTEPAAEPVMEPLMDEDTAADDRPLVLPDDHDRYPRAPMDGSPSDDTRRDAEPPSMAGADREPEPPAAEEEPAGEPGRDLMSDPDAPAPQAFPPSLTPAPSTPEMTDFGQLQVQVFKASGALPVEDAVVTIFSENPDGSVTPITVTRTNRSGFTPAITVPTVSASLSLEPGHEHPYASYRVQVIAPGYFTVEDIHVPVFGGITSVQPVEMLPLPENHQGSDTVTYPESEPEL